VRDWLYGLRNTQPDGDSSPGPQTDAERLRVIHYMLTAPADDGGANITPKFGKWKYVDSLFPLHDDKTNQAWIRDWSKKTFLTNEDLDQIRDKFGEKVGNYFSRSRPKCSYPSLCLGRILLLFLADVLQVLILSCSFRHIFLAYAVVLLANIRYCQLRLVCCVC
jgi:hypothetical protein